MFSSILIFGILSGSLLINVLVGLLGSRREIGFGWAFILSVLLTPLFGLIIVLLTNPLPEGSEPKYGCLGFSFGCLGTIFMILIVSAILFGVVSMLLNI